MRLEFIQSAPVFDSTLGGWFHSTGDNGEADLVEIVDWNTNHQRNQRGIFAMAFFGSDVLGQLAGGVAHRRSRKRTGGR